MKNGKIMPFTAFFICLVMMANAWTDDFPILKDPYLSQKPPGVKAEFFFVRANPNFNKDWIYVPVYTIKLEEGKWT